jgi:hypothetical protein
MPISRPSALAEKSRSDSERRRSGSTKEPGSSLMVVQSMRAATSGGSRSMRKAAAASWVGKAGAEETVVGVEGILVGHGGARRIG